MMKVISNEITLELKSVHRFLSFSRSSSNSFNFAVFLSFLRRFSSRNRCSNSRLECRNQLESILIKALCLLCFSSIGRRSNSICIRTCSIEGF